jgi:hypothetical protein
VLPPKRKVPEPGTAMEPRVPQNLIRAGDARTLGMEAGGNAEFWHAFLIKPSIFR